MFPAYINGMVTAAAIDLENPDRHRWARSGGFVLSLLLHAALAVVLVFSPSALPIPQHNDLVVELVQLPEPQPLVVPEPPAQARAPEPMPPPPPVQLDEAPIAGTSRLVPEPSPRPPSLRRGAPQMPAPRPTLPVTPAPDPVVISPPVKAPPAESVPMTASRQRPDVDPNPGGRPEEKASQAVQDFVLAQVARHWIIDFQSTRFRSVRIRGGFILLPNGMLGPPFGKNDPWEPAKMISHYEEYQGTEMRAVRDALETFLQAARQAQPFRLPPDGKADQARILPLDFMIGDIRAR